MSASAYLAAFVFASSIAVGALFFLVIAQLTNARWFVVFRPSAEAVAATMPIFLLLFVPIALSLHTLYPWARGAESLSPLSPEAAEWVSHQHAWNSAPFFLGRSFGYLALWSLVAFFLRRVSPSRMRAVSAAALPLMAITVTLAAFDWIMPLEVEWASAIFGIYLFAGAFAGGLGAITLSAYAVWRSGRFPKEVGSLHFHALGRLLLVAVIFWAYIGLSQFLLMWIADLPHETSFYIERTDHGWTAVTVLLVVAHFALPFLVLLPRRSKESPRAMAAVGAWLVVAHAVDVYWLVVPAGGAPPSLFDGAPFIGITALSFAFAAWRFRAAAPYPAGDPALPQSLRYGSP